jgi:hypothetical protein
VALGLVWLPQRPLTVTLHWSCCRCDGHATVYLSVPRTCQRHVHSPRWRLPLRSVATGCLSAISWWAPCHMLFVHRPVLRGQRESSLPAIVTFVQEIDKMLGGGVPLGEVTEICACKCIR